MEDLIGADIIQGSLRINCVKPAKQEIVALDGPLFVVCLKIIFEQGYRFFRGHGSPYSLFGEVSGG